MYTSYEQVRDDMVKKAEEIRELGITLVQEMSSNEEGAGKQAAVTADAISDCLDKIDEICNIGLLEVLMCELGAFDE